MTDFAKLRAYLNRIAEVAQEDSNSVVSLGVTPAVRGAIELLDAIENTSKQEISPATFSSQPLTEKQKATNWETLKHIEVVMQLLAAMQHEISRRMFSHDRSKLESPEMEMFEQFTDRLAGLTYGSEEYKQCLEEMKKSALGHHYENNRHHPEFFEGYPKDTDAINACESLIVALKRMQSQYPDDEYAIGYSINLAQAHKKTLLSNINGMNLIDILEMIGDWKAATLRHNDGDIYRSVEINTGRFGLSPQLVSIILNTLPLLNSVYSTRTQKHLNQ